MDSPIGSRAVEELVDRLLALAGRDERERALLRHLVDDGCARSAAVWRRFALRGEEATWRPVRTSGAAELQPTAEQVRAVLAGEAPAELYADRLVLVLGDGGSALALGGLGDEERLEQAEALAALVDALDLLPATADDLDAAASPFPGSGSAAPSAPFDAPEAGPGEASDGPVRPDGPAGANGV